MNESSLRFLLFVIIPSIMLSGLYQLFLIVDHAPKYVILIAGVSIYIGGVSMCMLIYCMNYLHELVLQRRRA